MLIIISYKGPGTTGEEDLYVSTKSGGKWSPPVTYGDCSQLSRIRNFTVLVKISRHFVLLEQWISEVKVTQISSIQLNKAVGRIGQRQRTLGRE